MEEYERNPKLPEEAADCFMNDLGFGTAGLRSEMDVGFNRMNEVTVRLASMVHVVKVVWLFMHFMLGDCCMVEGKEYAGQFSRYWS